MNIIYISKDIQHKVVRHVWSSCLVKMERILLHTASSQRDSQTECERCAIYCGADCRTILHIINTSLHSQERANHNTASQPSHHPASQRTALRPEIDGTGKQMWTTKNELEGLERKNRTQSDSKLVHIGFHLTCFIYYLRFFLLASSPLLYLVFT